MPQLASPSRRALAALAALVLALAALVAAGCGGGGGDEDADPAEIAPRNTLVYLSAQVRPEGDQKEAIDAIARKMRVDDPGRRIQDLLNRSMRKSGSKLTYQDDIDPWLGRRAAVAVTTLGSAGRDAQAAAILAAKDTGKAEDAVNKLADEEKPAAAKREYEGVDYRYDADDRSAAGVVEDFVVVGDERAFKAIVDASKGDGLTDNEQYSEAAGDAEDKLGFGFVDTRSLVGALGAQGQIPGGGQALQQLVGATREPVTMTLDATPRNVTLEAEAAATRQARQARPNAVVPELPGDAWLAVGLPNVGQVLRQTLEQVGGGVGAGLVETAQQQIRAATGLDLNRDIIPTLGEMAIFAEGGSVLSVGGGVVIETPSRAAARRVLDRLQPLIRRMAPGVTVADASVAGARGLKVTAPRLPGAINAVLRGDRLVIAYTDAATRRALSPERKLGDSPEFQQATQSLGGGRPSVYVALDPVAQLAAGADPENADAIRQYLGAFTTLVAGTQVQGDKQVARVVLNVR